MPLLPSPTVDTQRLLRLVEELATHQRRVRAATARLCELLGVPYEKDLEVAAGLHDIGKLAIIHLVSSPDTLSGSEWSLVRLHPVLCRMILQAAGLEAAAQVAASHHERWDGTGYPNGLAGTAIPIEARILAAADTLVALTEPRSYRNGNLNPVSELRRAAGTQLDPEIALAAASLVGKLR